MWLVYTYTICWQLASNLIEEIIEVVVISYYNTGGHKIGASKLMNVDVKELHIKLFIAPVCYYNV